MLTRFSRFLMAVLLVFGIVAGKISPVYAQTNPADLAKAVEAIEQLDTLRSGLAAGLADTTEPPTLQTMKAVCQPVGMKAKQLGQDHGWQVKQMARKYRNPAHGPDTLHSQMALAKFDAEPELMGFWQRETLEGQAGTRYYRRINVEASCLACHGNQRDRPQFVKDNYPQDLAYDFNVGDLRGMYAVFLPDVQKALTTALSDAADAAEAR